MQQFMTTKWKPQSRPPVLIPLQLKSPINSTISPLILSKTTQFFPVCFPTYLPLIPLLWSHTLKTTHLLYLSIFSLYIIISTLDKDQPPWQPVEAFTTSSKTHCLKTLLSSNHSPHGKTSNQLISLPSLIFSANSISKRTTHPHLLLIAFPR